MIGVSLKVTGIEGLSKRQINRAVRNSMRATGERWHDKFLGKHFTKAGAREYGYGARSGEPGSGVPFRRSYSAWKRKKLGHNKPLVKSGQGEREAKNNRKVRATATSRRASVTISLPRVFNLRNPRSRTHPSEEIRRVSRPELRDLESSLVKSVETEYEKEGRKVSVTGRLVR